MGQSLGDITQMFALGTDGAIRPVNLNAVRSLFAKQIGKITLQVTALDAQGNVYLGNVSFHITRYPVSGKFAAPLSFPGLQLGGIRIVGKILNTDIVVSTVSSADGTFSFPNLPSGNLSYSSETFQNGKFYYGAGTTALTGAANIGVPLLSTADMSEAGFTVLSASLSKQAPTAQEDSPGRRPEYMGKTLTRWPALPGDPKDLSQAAPASSASVSVSAQKVNQAVTRSATLTVPKGTTKVTPTYKVSTIEYPDYVTQQSIFNDVWHQVDMNQFHRNKKLDINKPDDATISNLKVEVVAGGASSLALDEAPGVNVTTPNANTVRAVATFKTNASSVNGVPPPSKLFQHKYTLKATAADGSELSAETTDTSKRPLWRMPGGFARYGSREPGHDDWVSYRTYNWMVANAQHLTAINDVSGEHGKNLGHASHARGSDIDMYHFYRFPGAAANSGTSS